MSTTASDEIPEPEKADPHWRVENALERLYDAPDEKAIRIESNPNPMFVTLEDGDLEFWAHDYTWRCQERSDVTESVSSYETVVDELHGYANAGYGISMDRTNRIDTERKPKATSLGDFA
ncbi:hypothetical protein [Halostagnicola kamekurae]|uniref:Uncharacterized protein n=1 Tax=Halostagnicola kamekurae TaxID=619731 RepID=A0A1I6UXZ5_9EURY|nr:hypothetical protein [Halostagnicola kamekurae]SFT06290.1 hypothetical protein SAMN04488556_4163 [Halostagnicola kamekurae]